MVLCPCLSRQILLMSIYIHKNNILYNFSTSDPQESKTKGLMEVIEALKHESRSKELVLHLNKIKAITDISCHQQLCGKSLLHHIVVYLNNDYLEIALKHNIDPWCKNSDDGKLALHAAIEGGKAPMTRLLLKEMRTNNECLQDLTQELIQKLLSNEVPVEKREQNIDYKSCLEAILSEDAIIGRITQLNWMDKSDPLVRALLISKGEFKRLIEEKSKLRILPGQTGNNKNSLLIACTIVVKITLKPCSQDSISPVHGSSSSYSFILLLKVF